MKDKTVCQRSASGNCVIVLVTAGILLAASYITTENKEISAQRVEQTAITEILSKAGTAVIVTDTQGQVLYWDDNAVKMFGDTSQSALAKNIKDYLQEGDDELSSAVFSPGEREAQTKILFSFGRDIHGELIPLMARLHAPFKEDQILIFLDEIDTNTLTNK